MYASIFNFSSYKIMTHLIKIYSISVAFSFTISSSFHVNLQLYLQFPDTVIIANFMKKKLVCSYHISLTFRNGCEPIVTVNNVATQHYLQFANSKKKKKIIIQSLLIFSRLEYCGLKINFLFFTRKY